MIMKMDCLLSVYIDDYDIILLASVQIPPVLTNYWYLVYLFCYVGNMGRRKSKSSGGATKSRQSFTSSLPRTPKGEDILFRPTTVEPDTSSDSEDYENYESEREYLLPSIGPPTILQYLKESQHPPLSNEEVEDRQEYAKNEMLKKSMFSGPCMFCHEEVLPFPSIEEMERFAPDQVTNLSFLLLKYCITRSISIGLF